MRRNRGSGAGLLLAPFLACTLLGAVSAHAADEQGPAANNPVEIGVFGGLHFYDKDHGLSRHEQDETGLSPDTGGVFGLRLSYNLMPWLGIEAEGAISPTRTRDDQMRTTIFSYRGQIIGTIIPTGYVRPFVLVGFGGMTAFPQNRDILQRDTDGFFHAGVGSKFPLTDMFGLRLDGRILAPPAMLSDVAKSGTETHFGGPDFEVLLSAYVGFGAEPPAAPPPPPPPPPVVEKDSDGDGILDKDDRCPREPEDRDGFEDADGCPDLDNDADGIADANDKCVNEPEDKDNFQDEDGCPDPDNDGDGILDANDKCVNEPETMNNYQDTDGCPDEVPAAVKKFTGVIQGINYKTNSAKILKGSFKVLDKAVQVLIDYPDVRLEIGGHTDNVGTAEHNLELSQKRADAVRDYMISKGIQSDRLTAVGYGMDKPLTSNKTKKDKAKNRRTEFTLIGAAK